MDGNRGTEDPSFTFLPRTVDVAQANPARAYDYWLGGSANFAVDRERADEMIRADPKVVDMARENRAFLGRVVRWCVDSGVNQFLDLGSGIPTVGNVHEIAQHRDPRSRVAYVDNEPIAVAHGRQLLSGNPLATTTHADLLEPETVLQASGVNRLLDFRRPIAVLAVMVLHYFPDTDMLARILARYRSACPSGSYLALTHLSTDNPRMDMASIATVSERSTHPAHPRSHQQIQDLIAGAELVDPGIVWVHEWNNPDLASAEPHHGVYGAVVRIP